MFLILNVLSGLEGTLRFIFTPLQLVLCRVEAVKSLSCRVSGEIWDLIGSVSEGLPTYFYSMFISGFHHQVMSGSRMRLE